MYGNIWKRLVAALQVMYRLISGRDHACLEAIKRLAAVAVSNSVSSNGPPTYAFINTTEPTSHGAYYYSNHDDAAILGRLASDEDGSSTLKSALSKRLIDDAALIKRVGRVPESQKLDLKALFKSGGHSFHDGVYNLR